MLIYSGHNEFYGSLGVGSTERISGNPGLVNMVISLRELRLVQLLTACYEKVEHPRQNTVGSWREARMERMVHTSANTFRIKTIQQGSGAVQDQYG